MANTTTRLSANGSLIINGSFDEVTRIVPNGLILYYDAGKSYSNGTGNVVFDLSSSNNQGIIAGRSTNSFGGATDPVYASANSGYFILNGNGGYITSSISYLNPSEFTIGVWFRTATTTRASKLIGYGNSQYQNSISGTTTFESSYDRHLWMGADNRVYFGIYPNQVVTINSSSTYTDNVWHYAVGTFSGSQSAMRLYVDGVLIGSNTQFNFAQSYNGYWKIGAGTLGGWPSNSPGSSYFLGDIGPAKVYNRALSAQEVLQNYNVDAVRFGRTATRYSVNKLTANTLYITNEYDELTFNPTANVAINLFNYTQDFSNAYWNKRLTITSTNQLAPDNTLTATLFTYNLQFAVVQLSTSFYFTNTFGKTYTFSCYVKATTTDIALTTNSVFCNYNVTNGTLSGAPSAGTASITRENNGFYRCTLTFTSTSTTENFAIWLGGYNGGIWTGQTITVWGPQVELGNNVTIYQAKGASGLLQSNTAMKTTNTGNVFIRNTYDEVSGVLATTDGLVAYFDADKTESYPGTGTTWLDLTPNKLNATPNGSTPPIWEYSTSSFSYQAGKLTQQPLLLPVSNLVNTPSFTYEAWVKQRDFNTNNEYNNQLFGRENYLVAGFRCGVTESRRPRFWTDQSGGTIALLSSITTTLNVFYQLVVTYDSVSTSCRMYINGVSAGSTTGTYVVPAAAYRLGIGAGVGGTYDQIGNIGIFIVYNRALTQQEVVDNFNSQRRRFGI